MNGMSLHPYPKGGLTQGVKFPYEMKRLTPTKDAAVHRLAKSITQLTLCQVTTSEVDDATKLLEKARQKV